MYTSTPSDSDNIYVKVVENGRRSCLCLPASVNILELVISSPLSSLLSFLPNASKCSDNTSPLNVSLEVSNASFNSDGVFHLSKHYRLKDCWRETGRRRSYEVCGIQAPSPPRNVKALLAYDSNTTVTVTWDPPLYYNTPLASFRLRLCVRRCTDYYIPPTDTVYVFNATEELDLEGKSTPVVFLRTGVNTSYGHLGNCYYKNETLNQQFGPRTKSPIIREKAPSSSQPSQQQFTGSTAGSIAVVVTSVGASVLSCLIFVLGIVLWILRRKYVRSSIPLDPPISVFLASSAVEEEAVQFKIRHLAHELAEYGVESMWYEYEKTRKNGPAVLGITQWVETQFLSCDYVLFVCTKQFVGEWQRDADSEVALVPIVWSSRHILDGVISHQKADHKYIVILLGDNPKVPTTLKKFKIFKIFKKDTLLSNKLLHHIFNQPMDSEQFV
jgi:hypothetical protein